MAKRITITPRGQLMLISSRWQGKFAEEAAEILIREGRYGEVLQAISGLSLADLKGESLQVKKYEKSQKKRIQRGKQVDTIKYPTGQVPQEPIDTVAEENTIQNLTNENWDPAFVSDEKMYGNAEIQDDLFLQ